MFQNEWGSQFHIKLSINLDISFRSYEQYVMSVKDREGNMLLRMHAPRT